ncbi:hypothetical protein SIAM614_01579 [Stappia aggregata IAM 12614]|uniref:Uncharacterized protein n=1 Tax=Roseibium aggregatum (strain ATCC 25650 / DSM 13394 / JCM 20685 / NBRC 16684 / NCIMB 2208 / IAM 12614 / B1) TaxID=384765 RepID=A0P0X6_ROSAI|nr:hypothetical protein SIAM614_01579 [Stappia aggregata IAM 12614] [Roseibium aggregatum IAM 12614]
MVAKDTTVSPRDYDGPSGKIRSLHDLVFRTRLEALRSARKRSGSGAERKSGRSGRRTCLPAKAVKQVGVRQTNGKQPEPKDSAREGGERPPQMEFSTAIEAVSGAGRLAEADAIRIATLRRRARKEIFERIKASRDGSRDVSADLQDLLSVEFPVLFCEELLAERPQLVDLRADLQGILLILLEQDMLTAETLQLFCLGHSGVCRIPAGSLDAEALEVEARTFCDLLQRAAHGYLPDEVFAYLPERRDAIAGLYESAFAIRGMDRHIGKLQADCLFAKALALRMGGEGGSSQENDCEPGLAHVAHGELLAQPHRLLAHIGSRREPCWEMDLLLAQIALWEQEIDLHEQRALAVKSAVRPCMVERLDAAISILNARKLVGEIEETRSRASNHPSSVGASEAAQGTVLSAQEHAEETLDRAGGLPRRRLDIRWDGGRPVVVEDAGPLYRISGGMVANAAEVAGRFVDLDTLRELGASDAGSLDVGKVIQNLFEADLISTDQLRQAKRNIKGLRSAMVRCDPLDHFLSLVCFPVAAVLHSCSFVTRAVLFARSSAGLSSPMTARFHSGVKDLGKTASGSRLMKGVVSEISGQTDEQKVARFEDVFFRWVAGREYSANNNLQFPDGAVQRGLGAALANVGQNLRTSGNLNGLKNDLEGLDEALDRLQARQGEESGNSGNAASGARELLARIEARLGRRDYLLVKLSIHAAILSARSKSLDTNYLRVNAFDALEHADDIRREIADAGIANSLGLAQEDLAPLIDVYLTCAPERVAQKNAPAAASERHATYDAALLKELMSDLNDLLGGKVARKLNLAEKDRWLDELLSSVRSVPIQQKTSVTLVTNGTTPGLFGFVASLLKPALGALGVSFSRSVSYAQTVEIKRGAKQYEVRILGGEGSAMTVGMSANAQVGKLGGSAGRADVGNRGVCIKFASVEDVQKFLIEMFSEGGVSQETWLYDVKGFETVAQDTELTRLDGELRGQFGVGVGELKVSVVSAGIGLGTKSSGSVSTYRSRYFTEQKRKTFKEFSLTTTAGLLNSSLTKENVAEHAADEESNGLKPCIGTTGLTLSQSNRSTRLMRCKEVRSFDGVLTDCSRIAAVPLTGRDAIEALEVFRKTSLPIDIDPFLDSVRADEDFRTALESELHKARTNDVILVEQKLKPEILELVQQWEAEILLLEREEKRAADLRGLVDRLCTDPKSYKPEAIMIVPKRDVAKTKAVNFALFYVARTGLAENRQPATYLPVPS